MAENNKDKRFMVLTGDIVVSKDRGRKEFKGIPELMESISKYGLLHPLVVRFDPEKDKYLLMAGERRFRAMLLLGWLKIPCSLFDEIDDSLAKRIELEENVRREDLVWSERIEILRQIDELEALESGRIGIGPSINKDPDRWSLEKFSNKVGISQGHLSKQITFAKALLNRPDLKEKVVHLPLDVAIKAFKQEEEREVVERLEKSGMLEICHDLRLGSCVDLILDLEDESIDLVLTDPPFGIKSLQDTIESGGSTRKSESYKTVSRETDNMRGEDVLLLMKEFIPLLVRKMKPRAHVYMFCCHELILSLLEIMRDEGLLMENVPIIWDKGRTTVPFMGYYYSSSYEPILFGHKPPREKRLLKPCKDILFHKVVQSKKKTHVFEKPLSLLKYFIKQSSNKGDLILDPFAGSGSTLIAGKSLGRSVIGFELDKDHYLRSQKKLIGDDNV